MPDEKNYRFDTQVVHLGLEPERWEGGTHPPIYQTASHRFFSAEDLRDAFSGRKPAHIYQRLTNPTVSVLEEKINKLEGGAAAFATSSGMAAITASVLAIAGAGDEIVSGNSLFMSTYVLFAKILPRFGVTTHIVETTDYAQWEQAATGKTKLFYVETIGNPKLDVPDVSRLADMAHSYNAPLLVDNTMATPYLFRPFEWGADIVVHSTTKFFNGHGSAVGGMVVDSGKFEWPPDKYPDFEPHKLKKPLAPFREKAWREIHINFGTAPSPFHSYLTMIGLDTLSLRMERHMENAVGLAEFLDGHPVVKWVNYPGLESSPHKKTAEKQFASKGYGSLLTFGLEDEKACFEFVRRLKLVYNLANLGDCKTLVIHPASSQYVSFDDELKSALGVPPEMLRVSVGIEAIDDIKEDFDNALRGL